MRSIVYASLAAFALAACAGEPPAPTPAPEKEAPKEMEKPAEPEAPAETASITVGEDDGGEYPEVVIESDGDQMMYKQTEVTIKANTPTRIKMQNNATSPAMIHNIVIVKKGEGEAVGQAGMAVSADKSHVPAMPAVLAATKLAKPGETTTVVVNLPAGEYDYVCTFPGHYMMMKGVLTVE